MRIGHLVQEAVLAQRLKRHIRNYKSWEHLDMTQAEAIDKIASCIASIIVIDEDDSSVWEAMRDICGNVIKMLGEDDDE